MKPNKDVIVDDDHEGPNATPEKTSEEKGRRKSSLFKTSRPPVEKETKKDKRTVKKEETV